MSEPTEIVISAFAHTLQWTVQMLSTLGVDLTTVRTDLITILDETIQAQEKYT